MSTTIAAALRTGIAHADGRLRLVSEHQAGTLARSGGWSRKETLGHLIDSAANNRQRMVRAALDGAYDGPGYAQDRWVDLIGYHALPWHTLLAWWRSENGLLARVVDRIPEDRLGAACTIGAKAPLGLSALIADYVDHLAHHVDQIAAGLPGAGADLNPYAHYLDGRDPVAVMASTASALASLIVAVGPEGIERRTRPDGWTAREIVCHLADTEVVFAFRLRQIMAEEHHVIQPFDQDRWNALWPQRRIEDAVEAFSVVRHGSVALARTLSDADLSKPTTHPERGEMTMRHVLATIAGHDLNHLRQLVSIRDARDGGSAPSQFPARTREDQQ